MTAEDAAIFVAANALHVDLESPARRVPSSSVGGSRAVATPGGPVTFSLPDTRVPLRFEPGAERLYGRVEPLPEVIGVGYDFEPPTSSLPVPPWIAARRRLAEFGAIAP